MLGSQCLRPHWNTYLGSYWPELIVTEQIYLSFVWLTAEMQSLVPINRKAQHSKEEHPHRAEEEGVELADHSWRFNLLVVEGDKLGWKRNIWKGDLEGYFYDHIKQNFKILRSEKLWSKTDAWDYQIDCKPCKSSVLLYSSIIDCSSQTGLYWQPNRVVLKHFR